jgi:hypothetical protein
VEVLLDAHLEPESCSDRQTFAVDRDDHLRDRSVHVVVLRPRPPFSMRVRLASARYAKSD